MIVEARYEDGVFKPSKNLAIENGTFVQVYVPLSAKPGPRSIRELGFVGMWADRGDSTDGVTFVNNLRANPRE